MEAIRERLRNVRKHMQRGAVLVEATMVTTASMLIALGGISVAAIGYARVSSDAASYYAARVYAETITSTGKSAFETPDDASTATSLANAVVKKLIPGTNVAEMRQVSIPNAGVGTNPDPNYYDQNNRVGGVSIVVPQGQQSRVTVSTSGIFGSPAQISVSGIAMEPDMQILNPEYNIVGDKDYAGGGKPGTPLAGPVKYFSTGMDMPPYFFSHNYSLGCYTAYTWQACPYYFFRAYGVAEYLDSSNWNTPLASIAQTNPSVPNAFSAMLCHQRIYAYIASHYLPSARPTYPSNDDPGAMYVYSPYNEFWNGIYNINWQDQPFKFVANWDKLIQYGQSSDQNYQVGTYTLNPLAGCDQINASF